MQPLIVPGKLDSLGKIGKYVMEAAKNSGLEKSRAYKLRLAVDEIATNIINYGYQRAGLEGVISIEAVIDERALTVTLDDTSGYYDPTLRPPPPAEFFNQPLEEREIGGWGVYLAIQNVDQFQYSRVQGHNRNTFVMNRATHGHLIAIGPREDPCSSISQHLMKLGYSVVCVDNEKEALDVLLKQKFELILLDIELQDSSAEGFVRSIKANNALRGIPIMILVERERLDEAEKCLELGADDYIVLPFRPVVLEARIRATLERQRMAIAGRLPNGMGYERDVQIGQQIQFGFLPDKLPQPAGWEITARFEPARDAAGDFYDSFSLPNGHVSLIVGDVSDKGITAVLFMALFRSLLRAFSQQDYLSRFLDPPVESSLRTLKNSEDHQTSSMDRLILKNAVELTNNYVRSNHDSANMFATIFFGILDPESGKVVYINAGHVPPIIFNQDEVKSHLMPTGPAVGLVPDGNYETQQTQLVPGDTLFVFTDSVIEAKDPSGQAFGRKRLLELIEKPDSSANALLNRIDSVLRDYIHETFQIDDITMLTVRYQS